jgi:hypothetical protein
MGGTDLFQVKWFGLAAFGNDENTGVTCTPGLFDLLATQLPVFGLVVTPHQRFTPKDAVRRKGNAP